MHRRAVRSLAVELPGAGMRLLVRMFTECDGLQAAAAVDARLGDALRAVVADGASRALVPAHAPKRYWKDVPRFALPLFEHAWWLQSATLDDVRVLMAAAPEGWFPARVEDALLQLDVGEDEDEDGSWVWNRGERCQWLLPEVAWVELAYQHDG